jgi:hypothetical protein
LDDIESRLNGLMKDDMLEQLREAEKQIIFQESQQLAKQQQN